MGLVITGNTVTVDHGVNNYLITTVNGNPKHSCTKRKLNVRSIFTRLKGSGSIRRDRNTKRIGDNCPLIYALKGKDNLHTTLTSIKLIVESSDEILKIILHDEPRSVMAYMPSSSKLSQWIAIRSARVNGHNSIICPFIKATNLDIRNQIDALREDAKISSSERRSMIKNIDNSNNPFSLKVIPTEFRHLIQPMTIAGNLPTITDQKVILIDDLFATGTTLDSANDLLFTSLGIKADLAICMFSNL